MDGTDLAVLVSVGEQAFTAKLFMTAVHSLWVYDYLLTLGDEIKYAWSGRRSWIFALFVANRYAPALHLVWVHAIMFRYTKPLCQGTKWFAVFYTSTVTVLAQITIALRIYAMTRKNKFLGCVLGLLIAAQFWFGIFSTVWIALRPLQPIPEIYLDVFKVCAYKRWRLGELIFVNMAISFDVLAFLIILVIAMRRRSRYPGIPTLLDTILRDATVYFILIFFVQFLSELFMFVTPEGIQHLPGVAITIFGPVMVSRLMLSLKKAAVDPKAQWSLETMSNLSRRKSTRDGTVRFAPSAPDRPHEISVTWDPPDEEDIEFDVMLRFP